jgi:uncharacterized membrane protein HdeD (DUF308 family)
MNENPEIRGDRIRAAAARGQEAVSVKLGDLSGSIMIKAILLAVVGVSALIWPTSSITLLTKAVAILLIVDAVISLVGIFRVNERGAYLLQAVIGFGIGAVLLFWPDQSLRMLMLFLGVWALLTGVALLLPGDDAVDPAFRQTAKTVGIVLSVIGAVLLFWPGTGIVTLGWVIGIAALIIAALLFWLASRMKGLRRRVDAAGHAGD